MSRLTKVCLLGALLAYALVVDNTALVLAGNVNHAKTSRAPRPSPLELRLVRAGSVDAPRAPLTVTADQPAALSLYITNKGPAAEVELSALGFGVKVVLPRSVVVEANAVTVVNVQATVSDCGRRPRAVQIFAHEGPPSDQSTQKILERVVCP